MLEPVVPQLRNMQKNFVPTLMGDTASHDPWRSGLEETADQFLKVAHIFFWSFSTVLFLLPFVAFREYYRHWNLKEAIPCQIFLKTKACEFNETLQFYCTLLTGDEPSKGLSSVKNTPTKDTLSEIARRRSVFGMLLFYYYYYYFVCKKPNFH